MTKQKIYIPISLKEIKEDLEIEVKRYVKEVLAKDYRFIRQIIENEVKKQINVSRVIVSLETKK